MIDGSEGSHEVFDLLNHFAGLHARLRNTCVDDAISIMPVILLYVRPVRDDMSYVACGRERERDRESEREGGTLLGNNVHNAHATCDMLYVVPISVGEFYSRPATDNRLYVRTV